MRHLRAITPILLSLPVLAGCAARPMAVAAPVAVAAAPVAAPAPFGGPVRVPPRLADGSFATPNRVVGSPGEALWHLRAGLNVAALSCRGPDEAAIVAGYNALLAAHRAEFAAAYRTLTTQYGTGPAGTDRFDDAMTVLYNYYALAPARDGLCRTAQTVMADAALLAPGTLGQTAVAALARLDAPFVAVFAAQDAWLASRNATPVAAPVLTAATVAVPAPAAPPVVVASAARSPVAPPVMPRLAVDPAVLTMAGPPLRLGEATALASR